MQTLCAGCGKPTNNKSMCEDCLAAAQDQTCSWPADPACCPQCGTSNLLPGQNICDECFQGNVAELILDDIIGATS